MFCFDSFRALARVKNELNCTLQNLKGSGIYHHVYSCGSSDHKEDKCNLIKYFKDLSFVMLAQGFLFLHSMH